MSCDVVLRVDKNPSNPERKACEVTVFVRDNVVRVVATSDDMYAAIDEAAEKVTRQLRKYKTRVIDRRQRAQAAPVSAVTEENLAGVRPEEEDDQTVEKSAPEALGGGRPPGGRDLLGHDFFVFINATTGLTNVIYHRKNGGYGIIKPRIEENE